MKRTMRAGLMRPGCVVLLNGRAFVVVAVFPGAETLKVALEKRVNRRWRAWGEFAYDDRVPVP